MIKLLKQGKKGQGMVEYGLILALVAVAATAAFTAMSGGISGLLATVTGSL